MGELWAIDPILSGYNFWQTDTDTNTSWQAIIVIIYLLGFLWKQLQETTNNKGEEFKITSKDYRTLSMSIMFAKCLHLKHSRVQILPVCHTYSRRPPWWIWWQASQGRFQPCSSSDLPGSSGSSQCATFHWTHWSPGSDPTHCRLSWSIESRNKGQR